MIQLDKKELRKNLLLNRKKIPLYIRKKYQKEIDSYLISFLMPYSRIGIYVSKEEEVDTHHLISCLLKQGKHIYVPKVIHKTLSFHEIHSFDDLTVSSFGILEPMDNNPIDLSILDINIIPLVGFDIHKNRIGYGKGYYDSILKKSKYNIGIAYPSQEVKCIPVEPWDIPLDEVLTISSKGQLRRLI